MFLQNWYGSQYIGATNWAHVNNRELDRLLSDAEKSTDSTVRAEAYKRVQKWLMDNAICVPLFGKSLALGLQQDIQGLSYEVIGYPVFFGAHYTK